IFAVGREGDLVRIVAGAADRRLLTPDRGQPLDVAVAALDADERAAAQRSEARTAVAGIGPGQVDRPPADRRCALRSEEGNVAEPTLALVVYRRQTRDAALTAAGEVDELHRPGLLGDEQRLRSRCEGDRPGAVERALLLDCEGRVARRGRAIPGLGGAAACDEQGCGR